MSWPAESPLHERMIFNFGARRSGTYWLQRIVTAHPSVGEVPSETHLMSHGIAPLFERFHQGERDSTEVGSVFMERQHLVRAARAFCDEVFGQFLEPGQGRVAERTPLHAYHLELIAEIYPDAKFVHIIRDGRDVARSIAAQDWGPGDVAGAAAEWRDAVRAARRAAVSPDRYLEVRYEDILASPEPEIERLYSWLGLPAGEGDLRPALAAGARQENVDQHGVGGVDTDKWRGVFSRRDLDAFMEVAGDLLGELGYPDAPPRESSRRLPGMARRLRG